MNNPVLLYVFHELAGGGDPVLQHRPEAKVLEVGGEAGRQPGRDRGGETQQPLPEDQREGGAAGGGRGDEASHDAAEVLSRGLVNPSSQFPRGAGQPWKP